MKSVSINFAHRYPGSTHFNPFSFSFSTYKMVMATAQLSRSVRGCHLRSLPRAWHSAYEYEGLDECFPLFLLLNPIPSKEKFKLEDSIYMLKISKGLVFSSLANSFWWVSILLCVCTPLSLSAVAVRGTSLHSTVDGDTINMRMQISPPTIWFHFHWQSLSRSGAAGSCLFFEKFPH